MRVYTASGLARVRALRDIPTINIALGSAEHSAEPERSTAIQNGDLNDSTDGLDDVLDDGPGAIQTNHTDSSDHQYPSAQELAAAELDNVVQSNTADLVGPPWRYVHLEERYAIHGESNCIQIFVISNFGFSTSGIYNL